MAISQHHPHNPPAGARRLFGRRKGPKSSARQIHLREALLPQLALAPEPGRDPKAYFAGDMDEVWLEVGFGGGEHLLELARAHPRVGLIGAEAYQSGTDKLLSKLETEFSSPVYGGGSAAGGGGGINIRLFEGDGRAIIDALPDGSLSKFFLLFPDPWPKTRHHKRRFVQMGLLDDLARVLKPGGEVRIASDDEGYVAWSLERLMAHPAFVWTAQGPKDWQVRPEGWPATRYERKALHGPPAFLRFLRRTES